MDKPNDAKETDSPSRRSIQEVRIDYLLEEEFACNADFLRSFSAKCGLIGEPISLSEVIHEWSYDSSTWVDLLVIFKAKCSANEYIRLALLIEDKITAQPQPYQAKRYKEAGDEGVGKRWDKFRTVLVAPRAYQGEKENFQAFVPLEEIADWLLPHDPIRAEFRRRKIAEAIEKRNKSGVQIPNLVMNEFHRRYYEFIQEFNKRQETDFFMPLPKPTHYSGDTWCEFYSRSLPEWCKFRHKIRTYAKDRTGLVEIAFKNTKLSKIESMLQPLPPSMRLLSNGKYNQYTAIEVKIPEIPGVPTFASVADKVEKALLAAEQLWRHVMARWPLLEEILSETRH